MIGHYVETENMGVLYIPRGNNRVEKFVFSKREAHATYLSNYMTVKELEEPTETYNNNAEIFFKWMKLE